MPFVWQRAACRHYLSISQMGGICISTSLDLRHDNFFILQLWLQAMTYAASKLKPSLLKRHLHSSLSITLEEAALCISFRTLWMPWGTTKSSVIIPLVGKVICCDILKFNNTNTETDMSRHVHIYFRDISKFFMSLNCWCRWHWKWKQHKKIYV